MEIKGLTTNTRDKTERNMITGPDTRPPVADGWAGAEMRVFPIFNSSVTTRAWRTNGRTDGRTDKASYRIACPQLKNRCQINQKKYLPAMEKLISGTIGVTISWKENTHLLITYAIVYNWLVYESFHSPPQLQSVSQHARNHPCKWTPTTIHPKNTQIHNQPNMDFMDVNDARKTIFSLFSCESATEFCSTF